MGGDKNAGGLRPETEAAMRDRLIALLADVLPNVHLRAA